MIWRLAGCGHRVRFITASVLVSELIEARDEKRLLLSRPR
jgi:DNA replication protein DnaC